MTDLRLELIIDDAYDADLNTATALSGRRIPLWLSEVRHEVLVTRVASEPASADDKRRLVVEAYCVQDLGELPDVAELTFIGWRVESLAER